MVGMDFKPPQSAWLDRKMQESYLKKSPLKAAAPEVEVVGSMRLRPGQKPCTFFLVLILDSKFSGGKK